MADDEFAELEKEFDPSNQPVEEQEISHTEEASDDEVIDDGAVVADAEPPVETPIETPADPPVVETVEESPVEARTYPVPDDVKFGEHRGQKLTAAQLDELGLLEKFNTWEHQELHHTKLYQELKKEHDDLLGNIATAQEHVQQEQGRQQFTPEMIAANAEKTRHDYYQPLEVLAKSGAFEEDFLASYPKVATQLEQRFDMGYAAVMAMNQRLAAVESSFGQREGAVRRTESQNNVFDSINQVASQDAETYGVLSDEGVRDQFIGWMIADENPLPYKNMDINAVTPQIIEAAFLSFAKANPALFQQAASVAGIPATEVRGSTGTHQPRRLSEFEEVEAEFAEANESRYGQ